MSIAATILLVALAAPRDHSAVRAFKKSTPCPYTREQGCVVDHVVPLCAGGLDHPRNMQWQTRDGARRKDIEERRLCAARAKPRLPRDPAVTP